MINKETLTNKEKQVLATIRNKNYFSVKVIKSNGEIDIIEGVEKIRDDDKINEILKEHSYQNLEIIQTSNKIVHINRTVRIKPKTKFNKGK